MRKLLMLLSSISCVLGLSSVSDADRFTYPAGTYSIPEENIVLESRSPINLSHSKYYILGLEDLSYVDSINIVFHNIYNWRVEDNWLSVYLFDDATLGWYSGYDSQSTSNPNWGTGGYEATLLGTWSDSDGSSTKNDVLFTTSDPMVLSYLMNGDTFGIGIDPDCHFYGCKLTVDAHVPEPATMLLFGAGLAGLAAFARKAKK